MDFIVEDEQATYGNNDYPLQQETRVVIGIAMEIHRILGRGFLEVVYKDALQYEFESNDIIFKREKEYPVKYKDIVLPHTFYADFVVQHEIILEVKAKEIIAKEDLAQAMNYLAISKCNIALILNFGTSSLQFKRVILSR